MGSLFLVVVVMLMMIFCVVDGGLTDTIVKTKYGQVKGFIEGGVRRFYGIPYAQPPLGNLRWRKPLPPFPFGSVYDATFYRPACWQAISSPVPQSEDCLFLNIYTPTIPPKKGWRQVNRKDDDKDDDVMLPVVIWVHGGGYVFGAGSETDPSQFLSLYNNVIVVTLNYRLGPFGFLVEENLLKQEPTMGSLGLQDQQQAFRWVQENILFFNGLSTQVTLFGESAGGGSVMWHMVSPTATGLFHRVIADSAWLTYYPVPSLSEAKTVGQLLVDTLQCSQSSNVTLCLRSQPAAVVAVALKVTQAFLLGGGVSWVPTPDYTNSTTTVLPNDALHLFRLGRFSPSVPLLLGTNLNEGTLFVALEYPLPWTEEDYYQAIEDKWGVKNAPLIFNYYSPQAFKGDLKAAFSAALGDASFQCPAHIVSRSVSKFQKANTSTFNYVFTESYPPENDPLGSYHSLELLFLFNTPTEGFTPAELALSIQMRSYWTTFASSQNGTPNLSPASMIFWPPFLNSTAENYIVLNSIDEMIIQNFDDANCKFWDTLLYK